MYRGVGIGPAPQKDIGGNIMSVEKNGVTLLDYVVIAFAVVGAVKVLCYVIDQAAALTAGKENHLSKASKWVSTKASNILTKVKSGKKEADKKAAKKKPEEKDAEKK